MRLSDQLSQKNYFYIMHLSYEGRKRRELWEYAKSKDKIGLDQPNLVKDNWNLVKSKVKDSLSYTWINQFEIFCNQMDKGDIVLVLSGWNALLGVAEILKRKYEYDKSLSGIKGEFFDHIRDVEWIRKKEFKNQIMLPRPVKGFNNTLSRVDRNSSRWDLLINISI